VVLLDEIEKAHPDTFNVLLQVLDEGRLTDNKGRTADFRNAIIIMTSNMGSHIIKERFETIPDVDAAMGSAKVDVLGLLKQNIRPEFLNRIDDIVMFSPLTRKDIRDIVKLQFKGIRKMLSQQNITLDATKQAIDFLAEAGFQPEYGARPVKRAMQREVLNQLSKEILSGKVASDSVILVDSFDDKLVFRNEGERTGEEE
jgi:ATP-dependent Clp protease ATP-binding subunit ClpB